MGLESLGGRDGRVAGFIGGGDAVDWRFELDGLVGIGVVNVGPEVARLPEGVEAGGLVVVFCRRLCCLVGGDALSGLIVALAFADVTADASGVGI